MLKRKRSQDMQSHSSSRESSRSRPSSIHDHRGFRPHTSHSRDTQREDDSDSEDERGRPSSIHDRRDYGQSSRAGVAVQRNDARERGAGEEEELLPEELEIRTLKIMEIKYSLLKVRRMHGQAKWVDRYPPVVEPDPGRVGKAPPAVGSSAGTGTLVEGEEMLILHYVYQSPGGKVDYFSIIADGEDESHDYRVLQEEVTGAASEEEYDETFERVLELSRMEAERMEVDVAGSGRESRREMEMQRGEREGGRSRWEMEDEVMLDDWWETGRDSWQSARESALLEFAMAAAGMSGREKMEKGKGKVREYPSLSEHMVSEPHHSSSSDSWMTIDSDPDGPDQATSKGKEKEKEIVFGFKRGGEQQGVGSTSLALRPKVDSGTSGMSIRREDETMSEVTTTTPPMTASLESMRSYVTASEDPPVAWSSPFGRRRGGVVTRSMAATEMDETL